VARLIDRFTAGMRGDEPVAPVGKLVGFRPTSIEHGKAVFELEAGPQHANPMGTLHGGIICDIADAAMGTAYASVLTRARVSRRSSSRSISSARSGAGSSSRRAG
jgi:acyl-coenzyme A thioesterase PaaI-like protein